MQLSRTVNGCNVERIGTNSGKRSLSRFKNERNTVIKRTKIYLGIKISVETYLIKKIKNKKIFFFFEITHRDTWRHVATQLQSNGLRCSILFI